MDVRETGLKGTHKISDIEAAKKGREPSTLSVVARVLSKFLVCVFSFPNPRRQKSPGKTDSTLFFVTDDLKVGES